MNEIIPLISCIVSFVFGLTVLDQYFAKRKPHQLVWAIGLFMYFISTGTEFWIGKFGLQETVYRMWYLLGAIFVAAYLGMGTVYLLVKRKAAHVILGVLLVASIFAIYKVFSASIDISTLNSLTGKAMPADVRMLTPFFNVFGTFTLVGGALYSAWIFWKERILRHRMISNILIAIGAILPAIGGTSIRFAGGISLFYVLELLGIIIIFIGFLRTKEVFGLYRIPLSQGFSKVSAEQ